MKKGQQRYISRVCGGGTSLGGMMKLGTVVDVLDVVNHAIFHLSKKRGFLSNAYGSYNIALRCRAGNCH
jgi:hypothetical protein